MDFSKLDQNEKFAAMASGALVIAGIIAALNYSTYAMAWVAVIAALGMLFVVLQSQMASGASLPGSKGSLMLVLGVVAGAIMLLSFLLALEFVFFRFGLPDLFFLIAVVAGLAMAWAGWREFQAEGGKFRLGGATASPATAASSAGASASAAAAPSVDIPEPAAVDAPAESSAPAASDPDAEDRPRDA